MFSATLKFFDGTFNQYGILGYYYFYYCILFIIIIVFMIGIMISFIIDIILYKIYILNINTYNNNNIMLNTYDII